MYTHLMMGMGGRIYASGSSLQDYSVYSTQKEKGPNSQMEVCGGRYSFSLANIPATCQAIY